MYRLIAIAMAAAAATALPAGAPQEPAPGQFVTSMTVQDGIEITINAIKNGTDGEILLVGERPSAYPGTPTLVQRNFEDPGEAISFDLAGENYGWKVQDVGHVSGAVNPLTAVKDYVEFKFHGASAAGPSDITHDLTATDNKFLACHGVVNGVPSTVLSWGNNNYYIGLPEGCNATTVRKSPTFRK